jgi:predicted DNA-binding protein (UPF0251 family)
MDYERIEKAVIEQLSEYNTLCGRIKVLEKYPIGNGMYLESSKEDDKLQDLHRQLKGIPSYMYLAPRERLLESVANSYLVDHPLGTQSQYHAVTSTVAVDDEDRDRLKELRKKIGRVIDARRGAVDGFDGVLERLCELQELTDKKEWIDHVLGTLEEYKPQYAELLRLRYIGEGFVNEVAEKMSIHRDTYRAWHRKAIKEYARLAGIE